MREPESCVLPAPPVAWPPPRSSHETGLQRVSQTSPESVRARWELRPNQVLNPLVNRTKRIRTSPRKYHETTTTLDATVKFTNSPDTIDKQHNGVSTVHPSGKQSANS
jgi:hypothetical protein